MLRTDMVFMAGSGQGLFLVMDATACRWFYSLDLTSDPGSLGTVPSEAWDILQAQPWGHGAEPPIGGSSSAGMLSPLR